MKNKVEESFKNAIQAMIIIVLSFIVASVMFGCNYDVELSPRFDGADYIAETFEVFEGDLNGQTYDFRFGENYYTCGADLYIYFFDTNAAVLNDDTTQATCTTTLKFRTSADPATFQLVE